MWYDQVIELRALFEKHAHGEGANAFLSKIESDLKIYKYPDPYIFPYYEGGTKWQRNTPPPAFVVDEHAFLDNHR